MNRRNYGDSLVNLCNLCRLENYLTSQQVSILPKKLLPLNNNEGESSSLQDLKDDSDYAESVALVYNFLASGDFNRWYHSGIHRRGNSILNIVGYVEALKNRERLD